MGTADGLEELDRGRRHRRGRPDHRRRRLHVPDAKEVNDARRRHRGVHGARPRTARSAPLGITTAFEGTTTLEYDEAADTITDTTTGTVYTVQQQGDREFFVDEDGNRVSDQSWKANVGLRQLQEAASPTTGSAATSSASSSGRSSSRRSRWSSTFLLGLLFAFTLNDPRMRGQKIYRAILIMPVRHPRVHLAAGVVQLLQPRLRPDQRRSPGSTSTGSASTWNARVAVLLTNLWMGFPYMFLVCTGCPAGDPGGAQRGGQDRRRQRLPAGFRKIIFPLLLVTRRPAAGRVVRLQLQQLRRDLPAHRGRTVLRRTTRRPAAPTS